MKKQIAVIHGGDPGGSHTEYIADLERSEPDADDFKSGKDWKAGLQGVLGADYEVFDPKMPVKEFARYSEWKMWFEKLVPFLRDDVILIGHSLGAIFLVKYLSENELPQKIRALMLVAAPYEHMKADEKKGSESHMGGFAFGKDISGISEQAEEVYLYHSSDDSVVDFGDLAKFERDLPGAIAHRLTGRDHIWQEEFPEIVRDIKKLS